MANIQLTQGKSTIVDDEDYEYLSKWKWHAVKNTAGHQWYAARGEMGKRRIYMHHVLIKVEEGYETDHINQNGLDNRRANLRQVTHSQNCANWTSSHTRGFRGVAPNHRGKRWNARIGAAGRRLHLGSFDTALEAARAYDRAAIACYGLCATLNFPMEEKK